MGQIFPVARSPTSNDRSAPSAIVGGLANPASTGVTNALSLDVELLSATRLAMFHSGAMADVPMLVPSSPVKIATPPTALRLRASAVSAELPRPGRRPTSRSGLRATWWGSAPDRVARCSVGARVKHRRAAGLNGLSSRPGGRTRSAALTGNAAHYAVAPEFGSGPEYERLPERPPEFEPMLGQ